MILSLLLPALLLGNVEFQSTNTTEETSGRTQRFSISTTSPANLRQDNVTFSVNEEKNLQLEEELKNNQTSGILMEDDENFQDQEELLPAQHCLQDLLLQLSHSYCGDSFHVAMKTEDSNWCLLDNVIRPYNELTLCVERLSNLLGCYFPNRHTQAFFLHIHSLYFQSCSAEENLLLEDAPYRLVLALTLLAISLIPVLLYPLLCRNKPSA